MDGYKQVASGGAGICVSLIGCLCACSMLGGFITFVVFLGKFAFNSPDGEAWYGVVGEK